METQPVFGAIAVGLCATLLVDLWNLFLKRAFGVRSLDYCLLGRWILHLPGGTFRHARIADTAAKPLECPAGWGAHYSIGAALSLGFVLLSPGDWLAHPTLLPALAYGIGTVVFPFFILQPSLGLGVASSRTPAPTQARLKSLMTHAVYGIGLWAAALVVRLVLTISG